jgi:glutamate synthase domain-containing protein 3
VVIDGRDFPPEGDTSVARAVVWLAKAGWRRFVLHGLRGHRFIANGLGSDSDGIAIDVYGSSGDYLASGIDGATLIVHGSAQDQLSQIQKRGTLVVHGDVGQAFMYGAKGGHAFILGNAAGRPMINAVGRPKVVINGTALDYLAESFMAGDPLNDGGFVVLNGLRWDDHAGWQRLDTPYPGGNLFSLASGGAIYVRDPHQRLGEDQLNGGEFARLGDADWAIIEPLLRENEQHFGLTVEQLLTVDGTARRPSEVYRKIQPAKVKALQAEEAWVAQGE